MNKYENSFIFILLVILYGSLLKIILKNENLRKILLVIILFNCLIILTSIFYNEKRIVSSNSQLKKYSNIKFKTYPNIHLIAFDSMIPEALSSKYMGIKYLDYSEFLKSQNAIVFENIFVSYAPSLPSLNSIMRLADQEFSGNNFFAGREDSPLTYIFRNNGYFIVTGYSNKKFFGEQGKYIDEYNTHESKNTIAESTLCKYQGSKEKLIQMFGFCIYAPNLNDNSSETTQWYEKVIDSISNKSKNKRFTFHYIYSPIGHTSLSHQSNSQVDNDTYKKQFIENSKDLNKIIKSIVEVIKKKDPNSIVFIFGDHGPFLSRTTSFKSNSDYFVQDKHGVYGALLKTDNICSSTEASFYQKSYITVEKVVAGIIRCLSTNPTTVDKTVNFKEPYYFEDYLYE